MTVSSSDTLAKVAHSSLISIHLTPLMGPQWPGTFSLCVPLIFHRWIVLSQQPVRILILEIPIENKKSNGIHSNVYQSLQQSTVDTQSS